MELSDIKKTIDYTLRNGLAAAGAAARERLRDSRAPYSYEAPSAAELDNERGQSEEWISAGVAPRISVVVPRFHTPQKYLDAMRGSVAAQTYRSYELIETEEAGFSENINAGVRKATGDYTGILDHDDLLTEDALYQMARAIIKAREGGADPLLVYSDEDKVTESSSKSGDGALKYFAPNKKPDFNYDYLLSNNYICHFTLVKTELLKRLMFRSEFDGAQDHDLFLRVCETAAAEAKSPAEADSRFLHVPIVLYHWRSHSESTAESGANKDYAFEAGKRAIESHLKNALGTDCQVSETMHRGFFRVDYSGDIFDSRPDIGAVGGRLSDRAGRLRGGLYTENGDILFDGLPRGFSGGYTHRAACQQDAEAVDILNMRIRPGLEKKLSEELSGYLGDKDPDAFSDREKRVEISTRLCREIRRMGYRILWDPAIDKRL